MTNLENLREQVQALYDKAEDKDDIAKLTMLNDTLAKVADDFNKVKTDYDEIFKDYKEMIKHTSFKPTPDQEVRDTKPAPQFNDFFHN